SYADTIVLKAEIGERNYYVVEAVPVSSKKTLWITAAYIERKKVAPQEPNRLNPPGVTSKTKAAQATSILNIVDSSQDGKGKFSLKRDPQGRELPVTYDSLMEKGSVRVAEMYGEVPHLGSQLN